MSDLYGYVSAPGAVHYLEEVFDIYLSNHRGLEADAQTQLKDGSPLPERGRVYIRPIFQVLDDSNGGDWTMSSPWIYRPDLPPFCDYCYLHNQAGSCFRYRLPSTQQYDDWVFDEETHRWSSAAQVEAMQLLFAASAAETEAPE